MLKSLIAAAGAALLLATPALAGPAAETLKNALYAGTLAEGLATLEPLAAGDPEAAFGVGALKLAEAIEGLSQALYRHGYDTPRANALGMVPLPTLPTNPNPEPLNYQGVRTILAEFAGRLDAARAAFDTASTGGDYVIEINPLKVHVDGNGDGRVDDGESLTGLLAVLTGSSTPLEGSPAASFEYVGFDRADAFWFAGYTQVLAAQADFLLAHDFSSLVDSSFHRLFPKAGFPMQDYSTGGTLIMDPDTDSSIADLVAAIHTIDWPVTDAPRLAGVRERMKAVLGYSRQNWDAILAETDDNHELVPSPTQKSLFPEATVSEDQVAAWRATLDAADKVLDGTLLVPHWRFKQGFDIKAYFETAKSTDLVMILTGAGALPFLRDGPVASQSDFREIQAAFGSNWLGYAFWFN